MQAREDPPAGSHQPIVLPHRHPLHRQRHLGAPALKIHGVNRPVQVRHQRLQLVRQLPRIEANRRRRRRWQRERRISQPRQRVLALAPQQVWLARDPAIDSDDLATAHRAIEPGSDHPDLDQLPPQRRHRTVAPRAVRAVAGQLVDVGLVGLDHLLQARRDHPAQHLLQQ